MIYEVTPVALDLSTTECGWDFGMISFIADYLTGKNMPELVNIPAAYFQFYRGIY